MRNYNKELIDNEERRYGYSFDFDIMQPYMIKSFLPFMKLEGNLLELGSYQGEFTKKLLQHFKHITCIEASSDAAEFAVNKLGNRVTIINNVFEQTNLSGVYDNIILTHVLEHVDNPVWLLQKINESWLSNTGRLFLVCPNANAPSRQIAVKMGLIDYNDAVTEGEKKHGHCRTYSLDTLEKDIKDSGLNIIHRSGIFFKAFANFQWDQLLETNIITKEYLDGCYALGQQYPDLCSSIYFVCEKGVQTR